MTRFITIIPAGIAACLFLLPSAMADDLYQAYYTKEDDHFTFTERGMADHQLAFFNKPENRSKPILGIINVEVFRVKIPVERLSEAKKDIDSAINTALTSENKYANIPSSNPLDDHPHHTDLYAGNEYRAGLFFGSLMTQYAVEPFLYSENAFVSLPMAFNEEDRQNAHIAPDISSQLGDASFNLESMTTSPARKDREVTYKFSTKTKSNHDQKTFDLNHYEIYSRQDRQYFVYTLPRAPKTPSKTVDLYVFALYPYIINRFYK